tara:strand:+ start:254 stop:670 length:417 start_codon:yes stop_codon:yes gene_type:complete
MNNKLFNNFSSISYGKYVHNNFGKLNKAKRINKIQHFLNSTRNNNLSSVTYDEWLNINKHHISRYNQFNNFFKDNKKKFYMIPYHLQYEYRDCNNNNVQSKNLENIKKFYNNFNPYIKTSNVSPNLNKNIIDYYKNKY